MTIRSVGTLCFVDSDTRFGSVDMTEAQHDGLTENARRENDGPQSGDVINQDCSNDVSA